MGHVSRWISLGVLFLLIYIPLGGWQLLHGGGAVLEEPDRTYGADYPVPDFDWVVLLNRDGLPTADGRLDFFDTCLIRYRGQVREVTSHHSWYTTLSHDVLVEYAPPEQAESRGVLCPEGSVFLLPKAQLESYPGRYERRRGYEQQLVQAVREASRQVPIGAPRQVEEDLQWVEAAVPEGLDSFGYRIGFLDACGIEQGGTVQAVAETFAGTLYAYDPDPRVGFRGIGIPCPPQTRFLGRGAAGERL